MAPRYAAPPPTGYLSTTELLERWGVTSRTLYTWLRKRWLVGKRRHGRWIIAEKEAARWEQEHPRLRGRIGGDS